MFQKAYEEIKNAKTIIIHRHKNPDGDALGSQIGLYHLICDTFSDKNVYVVGDYSERYSFIIDKDMDEISDSCFDDALCIILDSSAESLISDSRYKNAKRTLRFDHHLFIKQIADVEVVDSSYESCCGIICDLARTCNFNVTEKAARALFTGTVTDSGRFRYDCTTSSTFERVSFLMKSNINISEIYKALYTISIEDLKIKSYFSSKAQFTKNNVGYIYVSKEELKTLNIDAFTASRAYVNTLSDLKDVPIWVMFAQEDDGILCEIRSSSYNINPIAVKYGGGGHAKASGAKVLNKDTAMMMLEDLDKFRKENYGK